MSEWFDNVTFPNSPLEKEKKVCFVGCFSQQEPSGVHFFFRVHALEFYVLNDGTRERKQFSSLEVLCVDVPWDQIWLACFNLPFLSFSMAIFKLVNFVVFVLSVTASLWSILKPIWASNLLLFLVLFIGNIGVLNVYTNNTKFCKTQILVNLDSVLLWLWSSIYRRLTNMLLGRDVTGSPVSWWWVKLWGSSPFFKIWRMSEGHL